MEDPVEAEHTKKPAAKHANFNPDGSYRTLGMVERWLGMLAQIRDSKYIPPIFLFSQLI